MFGGLTLTGLHTFQWTALTFLSPVMRRGVRKGSKVKRRVSMFTGDCLFPTEQSFHAEFTNPQKEGTVTQTVFKCGLYRGKHIVSETEIWPQRIADDQAFVMMFMCPIVSCLI